jgi:hypothetical protein
MSVALLQEDLSDDHRPPLEKHNLSARQPAFHLIKSEKTAAHAYETNTEN